ncbi:MAG: PAS domain S-box protein [Hyphomicrobiaceae bacterium]|nr:PAS domain S-box protein [Hyphomicrobiaceae bacterium]
MSNHLAENGTEIGLEAGDSAQWLRLAIDAAGLGTFLIDVERGVVHYSPELSQMLGFPGVKSAPVEAAMQRVHRDDVASIRAQYENALAPGGEGRVRMELRFVLPGGEIRWMTWNGRVEYRDGPSGRRAVRVLGACADITEQKAAQERLRESEARFRALVELSSDWYWEQDESLRFAEVSDPVVTLAGSSPASHIGKRRWELPVIGVSEAEWEAHRGQLARREPFRNLEYRRLNEQGEIIWMSVNGDPIFDSQGRFRGYRGTGHNITERKLAELRLRESEARFRLLADRAPVLIWVMEGSGGTYFNKPYLDFVGVKSEAELAGLAWTRFVHPDDVDAYIAQFAECRARRGQFEGQCRLLRADGSYRWMKSIGLARFAGDGTYLGYIGSTLDITDLKVNEERIGELVRELDHRVKNILARFLVVIERTADGPMSTVAFVEALKSRVDSMSRAHEILSRSHWSGAPLATLVASQLDAYASNGNLHISGPEVMLSPDATQALSIVVNELATNAAKYGALSSAGGRVSVSWQCRPGPDEQGVLEIDWREENGPIVRAPTQEGYGMSTIRGLLHHELDGQVELGFPPSGVVCRMRLPLVEVAAQSQ